MDAGGSDNDDKTSEVCSRIVVSWTSFSCLSTALTRGWQAVSYASRTHFRETGMFKIARTEARLELTGKAEGNNNGTMSEVKHESFTEGGVKNSRGLSD